MNRREPPFAFKAIGRSAKYQIPLLDSTR